MMETQFRAALVQLRSSRSIDANVHDASRLIREAVGGGAQYVLTPENTNVMELKRKLLLDMIAPEERCEVLRHYRELARELAIWLHLGSITIRLADDKIANRSFLLSPDGDVVARYDKIHMFDVDLPDGESYRESRTYRPGKSAVLADLPFGRLGLTICYDLRFPQLYRTLAKQGAHFITVPSAFTEQTGKAHWHVLLRARAIETGCFLFAAAQGGHHESGRRTYGHSLIVSPWGEILAEAGTEPTVVFADIDRSHVADARSRIPSLRHDRPFELADDIAGQSGLREAS
ncbi:MAG: carbon-nitrogen hydrolase family protein [Hyphomicrobiaceae bacterium]